MQYWKAKDGVPLNNERTKEEKEAVQDQHKHGVIKEARRQINNQKKNYSHNGLTNPSRNRRTKRVLEWIWPRKFEKEWYKSKRLNRQGGVKVYTIDVSVLVQADQSIVGGSNRADRLLIV